MLALEQMMQGEHGSRFAGRRLIGAQAALDDLLGSCDRRKLGLERRRFGARRIVRAAISRRELEELAACRLVVGAGLGHDLLQDLAVSIWADRQSMLVIPGGKAAFGVVVAKRDLAAFQRFAIGAAKNRNQNAAAGSPGQGLPIDIERGRVGGFRSPFQDIEPPRIVGVVNAHVIGHEIENEAHIGRCESIAQALKCLVAAEFGIERIVLDHVISVRASGARLEKWRGIEVTDADAPSDRARARRRRRIRNLTVSWSR